METKTISEMRHEVIEYAILLDNFLDEEILSYFGLDEWEASYNNEIELEREIFKKFFLSMSSSRKFELIKKIIKSLGETLYSRFGADTKLFREIRNTFAHSLYPEIEEDFMPKFQKDMVKLQQEDWEKMHSEAKALYSKIIKELDNKFYTKEPRRRRHSRFDKVLLQKTIKHYEELLTKDSNKKGNAGCNGSFRMLK